MAAKNLAENKRFVYRSSDNKTTAYLVPINKSQSHIPLQISQSPTIPARRVMVIRNTKHAEINQKSIDLGDFEQTDSKKISPVINNGVGVVLIDLVFFLSKILFLEYISVFYSTIYPCI